MFYKNKSNLILIFLKKNTKKNTVLSHRKKTFVLAICKKNSHNKHFVIEKLGSLDFINNKLCLNIFRIIFWMQFRPSLNPLAWKILYKYLFSKKW